jgi:ABC-type uncharacterized transport system permease subunit
MATSLPYLLTALAYGGLAAWLARRAAPEPAPISLGARPASRPDRAEQAAVAAILLLHAGGLALAVFRDGRLFLSVGSVLSAILLVTVAIHWFGSFLHNLRGLQMFVFPLAGLCALGPAVFSPREALPGGAPWMLATHIVVALLAYGLLTIGALHALLLSVLNRRLRAGGSLPPALAGLPPLLTMEAMLFRILVAGFALLSATVLSGLLFSEELFGIPLALTHKNVFTLLSWLIFAALLAGRFVFGWRGRVALRWTLWGFGALVLAYLGSRIVVEVVLGR